jgi:thioesterase domain-containing protein
VEALAGILRNEGWTPSWSSLVPIQPLGSKPPLFLVHGAEGNVLLYRQLARHLGPDQPVYGLQSQGLDGHTPINSTVQEMASAYVKEVLTVQPHGPYFFGGYCLGGIIAFEIAQQLTARGKKVELVLLLDTYNSCVVNRAKDPLQPVIHPLQNLWFHLANTASLPPGDRRRFLGEKIDVELTRLRIRLSTAKYHHVQLKKINDHAADRYMPQPYRGNVAVIRSKAFFSGLKISSLGWDEAVEDGLEIHELPIYPKGMLIEPFCRFLAETITKCLGSVR